MSQKENIKQTFKTYVLEEIKKPLKTQNQFIHMAKNNNCATYFLIKKNPNIYNDMIVNAYDLHM